MVYLYRISIKFYYVIVLILRPFHRRARTFIRSRSGLWLNLERTFVKSSSRPIWVHAASTGEFEQAVPILETFRKRYPIHKILLTFFSPAGYESSKDTSLADYVHYLPLDSPRNAKRFIQLVNPSVALFIKYEFWYDYIRALHKHEIPTFFVSSVFRRNQMFFHPLGGFYRDALKTVTHFFVQDVSSQRLLEEIGIHEVSTSGDTRFDRVVNRANQVGKIALINRFAEGSDMMVCGSVWPSDMHILEPVLSKLSQRYERMRFIVVPHNLDDKFIFELTNAFKGTRYTHLQSVDEESPFLILDAMGILPEVYHYGKFAYVGGGFRGAVHNVLEPAAHGLPTLIGKHVNNAKFNEVQGLIACEGCYEIYDAPSMFDIMAELIENSSVYQIASSNARSYVQEHQGATEKVMEKLKQYL